jgi:signal recognition particle receptor subunit beta
MVQINFALREVNCKIVYYGPGMSGKTTNLEIVHKKAPEANKGELTSIATEGDRTLFFDFMPLDLGTIAGMRTRFQLYTVPGQVYYNSTRKLVLQGVDGIVFVADSSESKMEENLESLENLKNNLAEYGKDIREIPLVLQYNKRDLPDALTVEALNEKMNHWGCPYFEAVAITGEGVFPTLKCLSGMVLETLNRDHRETSSAAAPARVAQGAAGGSATAVATPATTSTRFSGGVAQAASTAANPNLRSGSTMDQMMSNPPKNGAAPAPAGKPNGGGTAAPAPGSPGASGRNWQPPRKVDATPLEQNIRTPGAAAAAAPRRVQIAEEKSFPWVAVALGALIVVAAGVVLVTTGVVNLPF